MFANAAGSVADQTAHVAKQALRSGLARVESGAAGVATPAIASKLTLTRNAAAELEAFLAKGRPAMAAPEDFRRYLTALTDRIIGVDEQHRPLRWAVDAAEARHKASAEAFEVPLKKAQAVYDDIHARYQAPIDAVNKELEAAGDNLADAVLPGRRRALSLVDDAKQTSDRIHSRASSIASTASWLNKENAESQAWSIRSDAGSIMSASGTLDEELAGIRKGLTAISEPERIEAAIQPAVGLSNKKKGLQAIFEREIAPSQAELVRQKQLYADNMQPFEEALAVARTRAESVRTVASRGMDEFNALEHGPGGGKGAWWKLRHGFDPQAFWEEQSKRFEVW